MAIVVIDSVHALVCEQQHWSLPFTLDDAEAVLCITIFGLLNMQWTHI